MSVGAAAVVEIIHYAGYLVPVAYCGQRLGWPHIATGWPPQVDCDDCLDFLKAPRTQSPSGTIQAIISICKAIDELDAATSEGTE